MGSNRLNLASQSSCSHSSPKVKMVIVPTAGRSKPLEEQEMHHSPALGSLGAYSRGAYRLWRHRRPD